MKPEPTPTAALDARWVTLQLAGSLAFVLETVDAGTALMELPATQRLGLGLFNFGWVGLVGLVVIGLWLRRKWSLQAGWWLIPVAVVLKAGSLLPGEVELTAGVVESGGLGTLMTWMELPVYGAWFWCALAVRRSLTTPPERLGQRAGKKR